MGYTIQDVEGIGPAYGTKLNDAGIRTTDDFLERCCNPGGRKEASEKTGLSEKLLLRWANMADLMRISGIGPQYAELLEAAGVDTVKELSTRNPENLTAKMSEINAEKNLARVSPATSIVEGWIAQAKMIDPRISH